jgi:hypothetical protein
MRQYWRNEMTEIRELLITAALEVVVVDGLALL